MTAPDLLRASELAYEAATGDASWTEVMRAARQGLGAATAALWIGDPRLGEVEILDAGAIAAPAAQAYAAHFHAKDPWIPRLLERAEANPGTIPPAALGTRLMPEAAYRRSEFYNDFARPIRLYHAIGAMAAAGPAGFVLVGLHRPERAEAFAPADAAALDPLLPHLRRALGLRHRLRLAGRRDRQALGAAALQALPIPALVVDSGLRVAFANAAAEALARRRTGLRLHRHAPPPSPVLLGAAHAAEAAALAQLVRAVALGRRPGGAQRLTAPAEDTPPRPAPPAEHLTERTTAPHASPGPVLAALVTPLPPQLPGAGGGLPPARAGHALVLLREITQPPAPPPAMLRDLFGLTPAEAAVAIALAGGATAGEAAARRGTSLPTIRGQIRGILDKTGTRGLRELERLLAALAPGLPP